ncbi:uncharacterized protein BT62DRAFT_583946 [Guyanagaster necrorhizus]|uniref:Secreted protein n=1 Tax=Guyanagaster necrorhizus TaxID=856835 RepID=A0A9P8AM78_9AGAR|nr:uncharacterized protein BT62DRAFT_583946 [Guyanagaster necrorhizus MCA 3950]KAG7440449.1 hypothetical protein BT62DRAFT_583946 [Guyanagaster necrorhizus MCA 3950]
MQWPTWSIFPLLWFCRSSFAQTTSSVDYRPDGSSSQMPELGNPFVVFLIQRVNMITNVWIPPSLSKAVADVPFLIHWFSPILLWYRLQYTSKPSDRLLPGRMVCYP